jgi:hypothetical protein
MAAPWERDAVAQAGQGRAVAPWERDPVDAPPAGPAKTQVGTGTAGVRGLAQGAAGLGAGATMMAGAPLATAIDYLIGAAKGEQSFAARDRLFRGVDRAYDSSRAWAIDPNTEETTTAGKVANVGGNLASAFLPLLGMAGTGIKAVNAGLPLGQRLTAAAGASLPVTAPIATTAAAEGVRAGATTPQALAAFASSLGINTAASTLPLSLPGGLMKRTTTGAAIGAPAGLADQAAQNAIYSDIDALQGDLTEAAAFGGGLNAGLAALFGARAPRIATRPGANAAPPPVAEVGDVGADAGPQPLQSQTISDAIARAILDQVQPQQPDAGARRIREAELAEAFPADPAQPTPVLRREDFVPDEAAREMVPVRPDVEPQPIYDATGTLVDPNVADARRPADRAYVEQGINPAAAENAFARARAGVADTVEAKTGPEARTLRAELAPEDLDRIARYLDLPAEEVAGLKPNSQRRLLARAMEAEAADAARAEAGPMVARDITGGTGGDGPMGPASRPNVPGDPNYKAFDVGPDGKPVPIPGAENVQRPEARTFDEGEAAAQRPPDPKMARKKARDLEELAAARSQRDRIIDSPTMRDTQRKLDAGERISEAEQKAYNAARQQLDAVSKRVRELESSIYQTEGRSEAGSRATSGAGDRPFRPGNDPNAALYRRRAEEQARQAEEAELDRLEAEWRKRREMDDARRARQEGEARRGEGKPEDRYNGVPHSDTAQMGTDGKFRTDSDGFVMSDKGAPIWFPHQRDAGRWILSKGNKQSPSQVYEIANHPEGKGFTVRVTKEMDQPGGGRRPGDQQPQQSAAPAVRPNGQGGARGATPEADATAPRGDADAQQPRADQDGAAERTTQAEPEPAARAAPEVEAAPGRGADAAGDAGRDGADAGVAPNPDPGPTVRGVPNKVEQQQILDGVRGKDSAVDVAKWLSDAAPSAVHRTIAKAVHGVLTKLEQMGMAMRFEVVERGTPAAKDFRNGVRGRNTGRFSRTKGAESITRIGGQSMGDAGNGLSYTTLLHELVHAATTAGMYLAKKKFIPDTDPIAVLSREAERIFDAVKRESNSRLAQFKAGTRGMTPADREAILNTNALENPFELIAWGTTDKQFQDWLETIAYKPRGGTAWTAMVDAIRGFLGLSPRESTALSAVISVSDRLMAADQGSVAKGINLGVGRRVMQAPNERADTPDLPASAGKGIPDIVSSLDTPAFDSLSPVITQLRQLGDNLNSPERDGLKLSANPIGDVLEGVWKATKAGAELLGMSKDDWKRYGEDFTAKRKDVQEAFAGWKAAKFGDGPAAGVYKAALDNFVAHWGRTFLMSNQGALQTLENLSGSQAIKDLRLMFDNNAGRGDSTGETFGEAVQRHSKRHQNTINKVLDGLSDAEAKQVTRLLQNRSAIRAGTKVGDAAQALARTLDDLLKYQREAGIDVGNVKEGYFPREVDLAAVLKDPAGFEKAAERAYLAAGLDPAEAKKAAVAWRQASTMSGQGSPENPFLGMSTTIPHGDQMKARQLTKDADNIMRDFLIQDPRDILNTYVNKAVRRAEFERRLGGIEKDAQGRVTTTTAGWDRFTKKLFDEGNGHMIDRVIPHVQSMVGELPSQTTARGRAGASWLQSLAVIQYLKLATLASIIEPMVAAQRTGDVRDLYRPMLGTIQDISNRLATKLGAESWVSKDAQESREIAELLGITASSLTQDSVILLQTTGAIEGAPLIAGKKWTSPQALTNKAVTYSGLRHWTDATRNSMTGVGRTYIQKMARDFLAGRKMAEFHLADLGIQRGKEMEQFAQWVAGKDKVRAEDITSGPIGDKYAAALGRLVDQVIMSPKGSEKPYFTASPYGRVAYGLMSYLYGFQQNVLNRQARLLRHAATLTAGSPEDRKEAAKLVGALSMLVALPVLQRALLPVRDVLRGRGEKRKEMTEGENWLEAISRSGLTGAADPLLNMVTAARYERDPASIALGPVLGTTQSLAMNLAQAHTDRNSAANNTHERQVARDIYNAFIDPAISTLAVAFMPAPVAIAVGQATAAEPVRDAFVTATMGPEDPKRVKRREEKRRREERERALGR